MYGESPTVNNEDPMTPDTLPTVAELQAELDSIADPKLLAVNERHGDAHSVNLTKLRGIAKRLKAQPELAQELWDTGGSNERLLALLLARPKNFTAEQYDQLLRQAATAKEQDWLVGYLVGKSRHAEELRVAWFDDADPRIASAAWTLTADRVAKRPDGLDLEGLLDRIEAQMATAESKLQWAMNMTLAQIGIHHPELRARALEIGERLEVLKDYPTPPNCTSPFAPIWITEMVRRAEASS